MNKPIAGTATAAVITVIAAGGGSGGTGTGRGGPAAAPPPASHAATPAPAKTVSGQPAPTVTQAGPAQAAPAAPAAGASQYCGSPADQGGISVNSVTSCPFAENVESAWESSSDASSVTASSPATGLTYTMSCTATGTGYEVCTGGNNAWVEFPVTSANASLSGQFDNLCTQCAVSTLSQSIASEQQSALQAAPSDDYDSPDNASVNVALTPLGDNTYSATATDSDGDTGSGDTITGSPDGNSWSDTGMNWSGPDVYVTGRSAAYWTTPAVSNYS